VKARIFSVHGKLRFEIWPENSDERLLVEAMKYQVDTAGCDWAFEDRSFWFGSEDKEP
jgi:hypothetical protein